MAVAMMFTRLINAGQYDKCLRRLEEAGEGQPSLGVGMRRANVVATSLLACGGR